MTLLQQRISAAELDNSNLQSELTSLKEELASAQQDVKRYSEDATQTQELYQRELMQHSKSVQSLVEIKEKVCTCIKIFTPLCVGIERFEVLGLSLRSSPYNSSQSIHNHNTSFHNQS